MPFSLPPRQISATFFLLAAILPVGYLLVILDTGGLDGIAYVLSHEVRVRYLILFCVELTVFVLAISSLLFSSIPLSGLRLLWLMGLSLIHVLFGLALALAAVPSLLLALASLFYVYRKQNA